MAAKQQPPGTMIALGVAIGTAIGVAMNQIAIGVAVGVAIGAALETANARRQPPSTESADDTSDPGAGGANGKKPPISPDDRPD
jgi:hypothetical protein